jgi:hypothetical protein
MERQRAQAEEARKEREEREEREAGLKRKSFQEEEEDVEAVGKNEDYSFLSEIQSGDINLKEIKRRSQREKIQVPYDSDVSDDYDSDASDGSDAEEIDNNTSDNGEEDYTERSKKKRYKKNGLKPYSSIDGLLNSFEEKGHRTEIIDDIGVTGEDTADIASPLFQHWNMINHLPPAAVSYFKFTIGKFLTLIVHSFMVDVFFFLNLRGICFSVC